MARLPQLSGREVISALQREGLIRLLDYNPLGAKTYFHPILELSDELRKNEGTRKQWNRGAIADAYYRRLPPSEKQKIEDKKRFRQEMMDKLRNHKNELQYP